jgi:hypothetical protein
MRLIHYIVVIAGIILIIIAYNAYRILAPPEQGDLADPVSGLYHIRNRASGMFFRPEGAGRDDGTRMEMHSIRAWRCMA